MAKSKSKKITLEEALVPVEEQPYKVPGNWCWVKLRVLLAEIKNGTAIKQDKSGEGYSVTRIESIQNQKIDSNRLGTIVDSNAIKETDWYQAGDIAMSHINSVDHVGKTAMITEDMLPLVHGMNLLRLRFYECCLPKYFQYFTQSYQYKDEILKRINMAVNQVSINQKQVGTLEFPLPPLAEQRRIVEQIESLFIKLDEAKEKAQEVIDGYEARNAAVYNAAFSGRLTAQWRKNNYKENKWETKRFDEVANIKSNLVDPSDYLDYPHIAPDNIEKRTGILLDYHTIAEDGVKSGKHRFYAGQILYSKIRPYLSKVVMVDFDGLCSADMYPIEAKENTKYLLYYMLSDTFLEQASSAGSRSVLPKINQKELSAIKVRITSNEEQEEVVRILDYILPMMQQVRDKAIQVVDNVDIMKKSILAKAFRGELGTNIPEDESAIELLKIILDKGDC